MLGALFAIGKSFVDDFIESRKQKRELKAAAAENRARLLRERDAYNREWEMRALEGRDALLQRVSFFLLSAPFLVAVWDAPAVRDYFTIALSAVPQWYQWAYVSILGAVWGVAELKQWKA